MRYVALILLSIALPAHAGLEDWAKDTLRHEIDRRVPIQKRALVFDLPEKGQTRYNLHWMLSGRVGPINYRDDLGDGQAGHFSFRPQGGINTFRPENMTKIQFELRKQF